MFNLRSWSQSSLAPLPGSWRYSLRLRSSEMGKEISGQDLSLNVARQFNRQLRWHRTRHVPIGLKPMDSFFFVSALDSSVTRVGSHILFPYIRPRARFLSSLWLLLSCTLIFCSNALCKPLFGAEQPAREGRFWTQIAGGRCDLHRRDA